MCCISVKNKDFNASFLWEKKNHLKYLRTGWNNSKMQVGGMKWHSKGTKHRTPYLCLTLSSMNHFCLKGVWGSGCSLNNWNPKQWTCKKHSLPWQQTHEKIKTNPNPRGKDCKGWLIRSETLGLTIMLETEILKAKAIIQENWHLYLYFFFFQVCSGSKISLKE